MTSSQMGLSTPNEKKKDAQNIIYDSPIKALQEKYKAYGDKQVTLKISQNLFEMVVDFAQLEKKNRKCRQIDIKSHILPKESRGI